MKTETLLHHITTSIEQALRRCCSQYQQIPLSAIQREDAIAEFNRQAIHIIVHAEYISAKFISETEAEYMLKLAWQQHAQKMSEFEKWLGGGRNHNQGGHTSLQSFSK